MWDDDELRAAVLAELDTAPPPAGGGLGEVVRRGRRRRRARHVGTALAVVALLTATGAVATALGGDPLPPAGPATPAPPSEVSWPRANLPARAHTDLWWNGESELPDGTLVAPYRVCDIPDIAHDRLDVYRATAEQQGKLTAALHATTPDQRISLLLENHLVTYPEEREGWAYEIDVNAPGGTGSLRFEIGDYTGTPLAAADKQAFDVGNCSPPKRHVLADGTVLQLYETGPSESFQLLTQTLRIFLPNGRLYQVTVQSWGSQDFETDPDRPEGRTLVGAGRGTLPLTERQLAEIGLALTR
jgi:hypothetical protein